MKRPILFFLFAILAPVSLLLPQPSRALDSAFFFNPSGIQTMLLNDDGSELALYEAEGVVRGLDDNRAGQMPDEVLITRSSTDPLAIGSYVPVDWRGVLDSREYVRQLTFSRTRWGRPWVTLNPYSPMPQRPRFGTSAGLVLVGAPGSEYLFSVLSDPAGGGASRPDSPALQATPGPLPGLGVVAAYQASRRLRRRIHGRCLG